MNSVIMMGRLKKDPELRFIAGSGKAVTNFTIAVDRPFAKEKTADFFNVQVWGKPAEACANYLAKGRQAAVKGYLTTRTYDGTDGVKRYVTEIVADTVDFIGGSAKPASEARSAGNDTQNQSLGENLNTDGFQSIEDDLDGIPF